MWLETLRIALVQLARNPMRTALTSLGILIGVAAVVSMVGLGRGATASVESDLASLGQNLVFVMPGVPGQFGAGRSGDPFTLRDVDALRTQVPGVIDAAPLASRSAMSAWTEEQWPTTVQGSDDSYLVIQGWAVAPGGRSFSSGELLAGADVCLLGNTVREELFGDSASLGERVRIAGMSCRVIGTLQPKGENTFGQDQDDFVLLPMRTFHRRISGNQDVAVILASAADGANIDRVVQGITDLFRERRRIPTGAEADFSVRDMRELTGMISSISGVLTSFLGAVAAVSLLVGGIGIMNIMTVSVTERTREIGIRLAIGARARDVLLQFLVEAVLLSVGGGVAGMLVGIGITFTASAVLGVPFIIDPTALILATSVSALIGIGFGFFPARRAAALRPIDALRHE